MSETSATIITAVDDDGTLFPVDKLEAHRRGLRHLAVSILVFCGDELLLQQRAPGKYHCGLLWANTCCSHPNWGESLDACAQRRLDEELGLRLPLRAAGSLHYTADVGSGLVESEVVRFFVGSCETGRLRLAPNPREVADVRWMRVADLRRDLGETPEAYAPWLRVYLDRAAETGIQQLLPR